MLCLFLLIFLRFQRDKCSIDDCCNFCIKKYVNNHKIFVYKKICQSCRKPICIFHWNDELSTGFCGRECALSFLRHSFFQRLRYRQQEF